LSLSDEDEKLLRDLLAWSADHDPDGEKFSPKPFEEMLSRGFGLSPKQRAWAKGLLERFAEKDPTYENLVSRGMVLRGREVETPAVLKNLPKKPPVRRSP
jgi:hypothetical protein